MFHVPNNSEIQLNFFFRAAFPVKLDEVVPITQILVQVNERVMFKYLINCIKCKWFEIYYVSNNASARSCFSRSAVIWTRSRARYLFLNLHWEKWNRWKTIKYVEELSGKRIHSVGSVWRSWANPVSRERVLEFRDTVSRFWVQSWCTNWFSFLNESLNKSVRTTAIMYEYLIFSATIYLIYSSEKM